MAYNKTAVAGGLLVGVILLAGILQLRFKFDPPEDNFDEQMDYLVDRQFKLMGQLMDQAPTELVGNQTITVTPTVSTAPLYGEARTLELTSGIPLAFTTKDEYTAVLILRGNQLWLNEYNATWELQGEEHLIQEQVSLLNSKPPVAILQWSADGYRILVTQPTAAGTVVNVASVDANWQVTNLNAIPTDPQVLAASTDTLWSYTMDNQLQVFSINEVQLIAQPKLDVAACAMLRDLDSVIVTGVLNGALYFTKVDALGSLEPTAVAAVAETDYCLTVARQQAHVAVTNSEQITVLDDNLSTVYPAIDLPANILFPQTGFTGEELWTLYSTSETLGEYQLSVVTYDPLATVVQPDATNEYTN